MELTVIPIVNGLLGTILKDLVKEELEIGERTDTIKTTTFLGSARILRREYWRPKETCGHSDSSERPSANAGVKNSQGVIRKGI